MTNDLIEMITTHLTEPVADAVADKAGQELPELSDFPCGHFNEGNEFTGMCSNCGHDQDAHEFSPLESNGIQVSTDGNVSKLIGISKTSPTLAAGVYILRQSMTGLYLRHMAPFEIPDKVYGDCAKFSRRVLKTFSQSEKGLGVLLSGEKGTGKTLTSKILATQAMQRGIPVILIDQAFVGPGMTAFLDELPNRCMFMIDEWEKIYSKEGNRKFFLGVLDGTCRSRHLWVMTTNTEKVGEFFISRPGRIRYHKRYSGLPEGYIRGIVTDHIENVELRESVIEFALGIYNISPDVLIAMIEECVMHNEKPEKFMEFFNVSPESPSYDVEVTFRHVSVEVPQHVLTTWSQMPREDYHTKLRELQHCQDYVNECRSNGEVMEGENMEHIIDTYPDLVPFVSDSTIVASKDWCEPFRHESNGRIWVKIDYLYYGDSSGFGGGTRSQLNFMIPSDQVRQVVRSGTQITVIAKNGDKVTATPAKKFVSKAWWGTHADPHSDLD